MTTKPDLEQQLRAHFEARADRTILDGQLEAIAIRTIAAGQRPAWLARLGQRVVATPANALPAVPRSVLVMALLAILIVLVFGAFAIGRRTAPPSPLNGLILFGRAAPGGDSLVHVIDADGSDDRIVRPVPEVGAFWSPDGRRIGFIDGYANADGSDYHSLPVARGTLLLGCWDWSADGLRCAAEGWNEAAPGRNGVYLLSALDHANPVQLTHLRDLPGAFSPDGSRVAFVRLPSHGQEGPLMVVDLDGTGERRVGDLIVGRQLAWTPDGRGLLVASGGRLFLVDAASGAATGISPQDDLDGAVLGTTLSPDGSRILFRRAVDGAAADLFTMRMDGTDVARLTATPEDEAFMDWGTHPLDP